ncbi:MAG TPA: hypothetical protein VIQ25_18290 [Gemmatimonadales bacterium]
MTDVPNGLLATSIDVQPTRRPEILFAAGKFERPGRQTRARPRLTSVLAAKPTRLALRPARAAVHQRARRPIPELFVKIQSIYREIRSRLRLADPIRIDACSAAP